MKRILLIFGILLWLGLACVFTLILMNGMNIGSFRWNLNDIGKGWNQNMNFSSETEIRTDSFSLDGLTHLKINSRYQSIELTLTDDDLLTVRQYDREGAPAFTDSVSSNTLEIALPSENSFSFFGFSFQPRLKISLPRSYAQAITLVTSSGSIRIEGNPQWEDTSLHSSSGSIRLESGLHCAALNVQSSSGSQRFGTIKAQSADFSATSGSVRLENILADGNIQIETSSGSIHTGALIGSEVSVSASSGSITTGEIEAGGQVSLSASSGSVGADVLTAADFSVKTSSGSIRIGALDGKGRIKSTSGSIRIQNILPRGDIVSESSSGGQTLGMAYGANCKLKLSTSSGSIRSENHPIDYSGNRKNNAEGTVGTGEGATLQASASSGGIRIE